MLACTLSPARSAEWRWSGFYKCKSQPGLFSSAREVVSDVVELVETDDGGLLGVRDGGDYMEKFNGSVALDGEVTLVGDGFWAGTTGRTTTLHAVGRIRGRELVLAGVRTEHLVAAERQKLDCELSLLNLSLSDAPARRSGADEAVRAASSISSRVANGATLDQALALEAASPASTPAAQVAAPPAADTARTPPVLPPAEPLRKPATQAVTAAPSSAAPDAGPSAPPESLSSLPPAGALAPLAHRRALVVGNNAYRFVPRLAKADADAKAMGEALARAGFEVTVRLDLDERRFKEALRQFRTTVEGGDEVVL